MLKKVFIIFVLFIIFVSFAFAELPEELKKGKKQINKGMTEQYKKIATNNLEMWFSNNGISSQDPAGNNGLMFPKNSGKGVVYCDGPILSGMVGDSVKLIGSTYLSALQPGPSIQGVNPADPRYRIYIIKKDWKELNPIDEFISGPGYTKADYERDYNEWPMNMGAPYELINGNRVPKFIGDEQSWYVMNDLNIDKCNAFYRSSSCGTEWQALIWSYTEPELENVIFKKYTIINKGNNNIENAYLSYFSDPDIGEYTTDLVGCDTILNLGYAYKGVANDAIYGANCPSVGFVYIQGPTIKSDNPNDMAYWNFSEKCGYRNFGMTFFSFFANTITPPIGCTNWVYPPHNYYGALGFYNLIRGLGQCGNNPWINEATMEPTNFVFSGDPVTETGWIDGGYTNSSGYGYGPRDNRMLMSSGPFNLSIGDTQEVVIGIIVGQGTDRLSSINVMKNNTLLAKKVYNEKFGSITIAVNEPKEIPTTYNLSQNYPNPFNPTTTIQYSIPKDEYVKLTVYDITGRIVKELVNGHKVAGKYNIEFNASGYASGTYYYKLESGEYKNIQKMMLVK
jgi:hypothetical protein